MTDRESLLRLADNIASQGANITYPSRQAAREVRNVVRELAAALRSLPQSAPALSPSQQAERLPSSDAAEVGADAALADEFEGMAKAHRAMGEKQEADNYIRAAEALRSVPAQPQAGASEPVARKAIAETLDRVAKEKSKIYLSTVCTYAMADAVLALYATPSPTATGREKP